MSTQASENYSLNELLAVFVSKEIVDGDHVAVGRNLLIPMAGALLAQLHHGPNVRIGFGHATTNLHREPLADIAEMDWRNELKWAESYRPEDRTMIALKHLSKTVFFIGGIQIDRFGNSNMIGVGEDYKRLGFRGPGAIGTTSLTTYVGRYYILLNSHTNRILVDHCDYISCVGWDNGRGVDRVQLGLPANGPKYCITPLCVMDFEVRTRCMRLKSLHPGITLDRVLENTGFDLIIPDEVGITPEPTAEELQILRTRIDLRGRLRD